MNFFMIHERSVSLENLTQAGHTEDKRDRGKQQLSDPIKLVSEWKNRKWEDFEKKRQILLRAKTICGGPRPSTS